MNSIVLDSTEQVLCLKGKPFNPAKTKILHHIPAQWLSSIPCIPSPSIRSGWGPVGHIWREIVWKVFVVKRSWEESSQSLWAALSARSCWACNQALCCQVVREGRSLLSTSGSSSGFLAGALLPQSLVPFLFWQVLAWTEFSGEGPVKVQMMFRVSSPLERKLDSTIHSTSVTEEFWDSLVEVHDEISTKIFINLHSCEPTNPP